MNSRLSALRPRRYQKTTLRMALVIIALLAAPAGSRAQGVRGTINGQVSDPTGAVVRGATVKLVNVQTQTEVRTVTTNDEGLYQFIEIEPATYSVVVSAGGFADANVTDVKVDPNRNVRLDVALVVSGGSNVLEVTAATEM